MRRRPGIVIVACAGLLGLGATAGPARADKPVALRLDDGARADRRGAAASIAHAAVAFADPIDRDAVDTALRGRMVGIQKCLRAARWKPRAGDVVALALVGASGAVTRVDAAGHDAPAATCVKKALTGARLVATARGGAVSLVVHLETKTAALSKAIDRLGGEESGTLTALRANDAGGRTAFAGAAPTTRVADARGIAAGGPWRLAVVAASLGADPVDPDALRTALATRDAAAAACRAAAAPALAIVVVDRTGKVARALAGGSGDPRLERCVEKALRPARFPATARGGALVVRY